MGDAIDLDKILEKMVIDKAIGLPQTLPGWMERAFDPKELKPSTPSCDICETVEDLYTHKESIAFVKLLPLLKILMKSQATGRVCKDCIQRLVKLEFRKDRQVFKYEDLLHILHDRGIKVTFDRVVVVAAKLGLRVKLKIRKNIFNRYIKRMYRREAHYRSSWDAKNLRYEMIEKITQRNKKEPPDKPTLDDFLKLHVAAQKGIPFETGAVRKPPKSLTLKTFTRLLLQKPFDIMEYPLSAGHQGYEHEKALKRPCGLCRKVICDPNCHENALYRLNRALHGIDRVYSNDYVETQRDH